MNVNLNAIVNPLRSLWEELVERRLWPILIVLVVALIAIPVVLSKPAKEAEPLPPAPSTTGTSSPGLAFQPAVTTEGLKSSQIRKRIDSFERKNPFTPQNLTPRGSSSSNAGTATVTGGGAASPTGSTDAGALTAGGGSSVTGGTDQSGDSVGGSGGGTSTETFYYHYTVDVKFGKTGNPDKKTLTEFRALPSSDNPVLVFMGVKNDGETAVFLITANASTVGEGACSPSDTECTFLYLQKDDKQTIEAVDTDGGITTYSLELLSVDVRRTKGPEEAASSSERASLRSERRQRLRRVENTFRALGL
jgi:hypothetical protein